MPSTLCLITSLMKLYVTTGGSNPGVSCAPSCLSSLPASTVPSRVCPSNQDTGLCGLIAATNINTIASYFHWSCTTAGVTSTNPCSSQLWSGIVCSGNNVVSISVNNIGLSGN